MKNSILLEGLQDTHSDFEFARRQWDKLGLGVNFDDAYNAYYKKNYDPEHWDDWRDPVYSEEAWNELVQSAGEENESLRRKQEKRFEDDLEEAWDNPVDYAWYFLDSGADVDEIRKTLDNDGHNDEDFYEQVLNSMDEIAYDQYYDDFQEDPEEWYDESLDEGAKREILKSKNGIELKSTGDDYEIWVNGKIDSSSYDSYKDALKEYNKLIKKSLTEDGYIIMQRGGRISDPFDLEDKVFATKDEAKAALKAWKDSYGKNKSYYKPDGIIHKYTGKTWKQMRQENKNESLTEGALSNGSYSLYNGWVKVPDKDSIPDEYPELEPELSELKDKADKCETIDEIDNFIDDLYKIRQNGLLTDGEYGKGNLLFKEIRNAGILDRLKKMKVEKQNQEMSLESLKEDIGVSKTDFIKAYIDAYGGTKKDAEEKWKSESDSCKKELVKGFKGNAKKNFLTDSLKEDYPDASNYFVVGDHYKDSKGRNADFEYKGTQSREWGDVYVFEPLNQNAKELCIEMSDGDEEGYDGKYAYLGLDAIDDIFFGAFDESISLGGGMKLPYDDNYCIFAKSANKKVTILKINNKKEFQDAERRYGSFINVCNTVDAAKSYTKSFTGPAKEWPVEVLTEDAAGFDIGKRNATAFYNYLDNNEGLDIGPFGGRKASIETIGDGEYEIELDSQGAYTSFKFFPNNYIEVYINTEDEEDLNGLYNFNSYNEFVDWYQDMAMSWTPDFGANLEYIKDDTSVIDYGESLNESGLDAIRKKYGKSIQSNVSNNNPTPVKRSKEKFATGLEGIRKIYGSVDESDNLNERNTAMEDNYNELVAYVTNGRHEYDPEDYDDYEDLAVELCDEVFDEDYWEADADITEPCYRVACDILDGEFDESLQESGMDIIRKKYGRKHESLTEDSMGVRELVTDYLLNLLSEKVLDNLAVVVGSKIPAYDPDWCLEVEHDDAYYEFVDSLVDDLFANAPIGESKEVKLNEAEIDDQRAGELAEYLDVPVEDINEVGDTYSPYLYEVNGEEYYVLTSDEAEEAAKQDVLSLADDMGLESFSKNYQETIVNNFVDEDFIMDMLQDEIDYYRDEEGDEETAEYLEGMDSTEAFDYIKDLYDEKSFKDLIKDHIDWNAVAEDVVSMDGPANSLARYDGEEIELGNYFAYRCN